MQIDKINNLPPIPMLRTPVFRDLQIAGHTVRVHKPKARQAACVAVRLAESFGETLLRVFASPSEDLKAIFEDDDNIAPSQIFKTILAAGVMDSVLTRLRELGEEIGPDHIWWYFQQLLPGNVELAGHVFTSTEQLDEANFSMPEMMEVFWCCVELAIYPTADDLDTSAGKSEAELVEPPPAREKKTRQGKKPRGATRKAGQSVRMSASSG